MKEKTEVHTVIIGAGVIGCAVASTLARKKPQNSIVILEAGPRIAEGITSRNSGVIHAGIYYAPDSLKARTCVRGNGLLYEWAEKHHVPFKKIGKLIVAQQLDQIPYLEETLKNARQLGARELKPLNNKEISEFEPALNMAAGIWSPTTGIIDPYLLTKSFLEDAEENGAVLLVDNKVVAINSLADGRYEISTSRETIVANSVVNAAGLFSDDIARMAGVDKYEIYPWRGNYFILQTDLKFSHLIYPVKDPGAPGLGVHLTIDLAGKYKLGPDVALAKSKDDFGPAPEKAKIFLEDAKKIFGDKAPSYGGGMTVEFDYCGIRPKLRSPADKGEKDFVVSEDLPGFVNMIGIESPGLTACLALADGVAKLF